YLYRRPAQAATLAWRPGLLTLHQRVGGSPAGASALPDDVQEQRTTDGNHQEQAKMTEARIEHAIAEEEGHSDHQHGHSIAVFHQSHHPFDGVSCIRVARGVPRRPPKAPAQSAGAVIWLLPFG